MPKDEKPTTGDLNKLIDELIHPYTKKYPMLILIDGLLHSIVEKNPSASMRKFFKYNFPKLLKHLQEKPKTKHKS